MILLKEMTTNGVVIKIRREMDATVEADGAEKTVSVTLRRQSV